MLLTLNTRKKMNEEAVKNSEQRKKYWWSWRKTALDKFIQIRYIYFRL